MGRETGIAWTEATWNPWWGCQRVNNDCTRCYAEALAARYGHDVWGGRKSSRRLFGDKHWNEPRVWNAAAEKRGRPMLVFCASMADVFEQHPAIDGERDRLFALIADTPWLVWQLLTKRPEAARDYLRWYYDESGRIDWWHGRDHLGWGVLPNIWIGTSIGHVGATWHADVLREIPAAVRFISAEPLTTSLFSIAPARLRGPDATGAAADVGAPEGSGEARAPAPLDLTGIDWLIVGGESQKGARAMQIEWAVELMDAAHDVGAAFFMKQLGAVLARTLGGGSHGSDIDRFPAALRVREFPALSPALTLTV